MIRRHAFVQRARDRTPAAVSGHLLLRQEPPLVRRSRRFAPRCARAQRRALPTDGVRPMPGARRRASNRDLQRHR